MQHENEEQRKAREWANNLTIVNVDGTGLLHDEEADRYFDKKGVVSVSEGDRWDHPAKIYHDESGTEEFRTAHPAAFEAVNERANRYDAPIEMHGEIEANMEHFQESKALEQKMLSEQQAVRDKLSADVAAREKAQLEAFYTNQNMEGLPAPVQNAPAPIAAEAEHLQRERHVEQGTKALKAYQEAGFITDARDPLVAVGQDAAEQALAAEKTFRQRQQQLADRISDPRTPPDQRERLDLVKTVEYHTHKADQLSSIIHMEQWMKGYSQSDHAASDQAISQHSQTLDHHRSQAVLAAQQLHSFDHQRNSVPKEVQARMGQAAGTPPLQQNAQGQKELASDPHIQALTHAPQQETKAAPPALERLQQRREEARQAHTGERPSAYVQAQLAEAKGREKQLDEAKTAQQTETRAHSHKAEDDRHATMTR